MISNNENINVVILAAGEGKRMHATCSKVLCKVAEKPMISWVIDAAASLENSRICVVVSSEDVEKKAQESGCSVRYQTERKGTGHAVMMARDFLEENPTGCTAVLCGDAPFVTGEILMGALEYQRENGYAMTVISAELDDAKRYGRIIRNEDGAVKAIREAADCTPEELKVKEINSGIILFNTERLLETLDKLTPNNAQGEYYITDCLAILLSEGYAVGAYVSADTDIVLGANDPAVLLDLNEIATRKVINKHLSNGVRFYTRDGIIISPDVEIAPGAEILGGCILTGKTKIGAGAVIGPNSMVTDSEIGAGTVFESSKSTNATVGENCNIGPYVQLRPDAHIGNEVKMGDFVEIKNSTIGDGTSVAHLTYIGDATVGRCCNFGCGTVFVNYDGVNKNRIEIGDFCFVGCNTNLIAPVKLGDGAYTAAGVTVTKDIPAGALAIDRNDLKIIEGWAARKLKKYIEKQKSRHHID